MSASAQPPSPPARHPSALALHQYHLCALPTPDAERVAQHLSQCDLCRADLGNLATDQRRFEREVFPQTQEAVVLLRLRRGRSLRARWRLSLSSLGLVAAAAAAWLFLIGPARLPVGDDVLRAKGDAALAIFAARGDTVLPVGDGKTRLRQGDRIRFVLWPAGMRYAVIASLDGAGHITVYHPFGGGESAPLPPQARVEIPGSITLDDSPGPERVFAVMAAHPFLTATVVDALQKLAGGTVRSAAALPIQGARQQSILFEKSP